MTPWKYNSDEYSKDDNDFPLIPEGEYQVKILDVKDTMSKTNKDMRVLKIELIGEEGKLPYNLVFDPENRRFTNQALGRIFDSFKIPEGKLDRFEWLDKIGAAEIVHEEYKDRTYAKIKRFLTQERQEELGFYSKNPFDAQEFPG